MFSVNKADIIYSITTLILPRRTKLNESSYVPNRVHITLTLEVQQAHTICNTYLVDFMLLAA